MPFYFYLPLTYLVRVIREKMYVCGKYIMMDCSIASCCPCST